MPNRILKESICASPNINQLSDKAEAFFYRLIVNSDDYGRFDGRPTIIISRCYPLRIKIVDEEDIVSLLNELIKAKLLSLYKKEDKYLIQISTWDKHQQIRAKKSKYPSYDNTCILLLADDFRNQMIADGCICPRNPIQSNPIRNPIQSLISDNKNNGKKDTTALVNTEVLADKSLEITYVKTDENGNPIKEKPIKKPKDNSKYGVQIGEVFKFIDNARTYKLPKRNAEAASIIRMLKKNYTVDQIISVWQSMKSEIFWTSKELYMMSVEGQIGAKLNRKPIASITNSNVDEMEGMTDA